MLKFENLNYSEFLLIGTCAKNEVQIPRDDPENHQVFVFLCRWLKAGCFHDQFRLKVHILINLLSMMFSQRRRKEKINYCLYVPMWQKSLVAAGKN